MDYELINIKTAMNPDSAYGGLSVVEGERDIPFAIKRVYYIYETEQGVHRGFHAHKRNWQLLVCPYGKIDIVLDDGTERQTVTLDDPSKGLILSPAVWHEMIWRQAKSILFVAASVYYDPDEYIRNYDDFLEFVKNNSDR